MNLLKEAISEESNYHQKDSFKHKMLKKKLSTDFIIYLTIGSIHFEKLQFSTKTE